MDQHSLPPQQRRTFLLLMIGGVSAVLAAAAAWPVWRYLSPRSDAGAEAKVPVARASVEVGSAFFFNFRGRPAVVVQPMPGQFAAFSAVCPHLGCIVKWVPEKGEFLCPCHAGRFAMDGTVLGGPPPQPLESLPVTLAEDQLLIG
jgi:cytochrome b6-f complex iron-sulfur subunit